MTEVEMPSRSPPQLSNPSSTSPAIINSSTNQISTTVPTSLSMSATASAVSPTPPSSISTNGSPSNSSLAAMLSDAFKENEALRREIAMVSKRAEKSDRILTYFNQVSSGNTVSPPNGVPVTNVDTARLVAEYEARIERAEQARDEAEARKRVVIDGWNQLEKYLSEIEFHASDARAGLARIVADGGGQLVLANIPVLGQQSSAHTSSHVGPAFLSMQPPRIPASLGARPTLRAHGSAATNSFPASMSLPPPPNPHPRVRPRSDNHDIPFYSSIPGQPPFKKQRSERREDRASYTESPANSPNVVHHSHSPQLRSPVVNNASPYSSHPAHPRKEFSDQKIDDYHRGRAPPAEHGASGRRRHRRSRRSGSRGTPHSRSSSRSSATSLSVEEMLYQASGGGPDETNRRLAPGQDPQRVHGSHHHRHRRNGSHGDQPYVPGQPYNRFRTDSPGGVDYRSSQQIHHQNHSRGNLAPGTGMIAGPGISLETQAAPLSQPGQLQNFQTHVFAPVVTGAPVKKTKFSTVSAVPVPVNGNNGSAVTLPTTEGAPAVDNIPNFPATNELGQRICRQCGHPGRYKENKCVEKWGPGPKGPGTVCDRCRKKMKRVERRGTLEGQALNTFTAQQLHQTLSRSQLSVGGGIQRSDTVTLHNPPPQAQSHTIGPSGTHVYGASLPGVHEFQPSSTQVHQLPSHQQQQPTLPSPPSLRATPSTKASSAIPRSPGPSIATLAGTGEDLPVSRKSVSNVPSRSASRSRNGGTTVKVGQSPLGTGSEASRVSTKNGSSTHAPERGDHLEEGEDAEADLDAEGETGVDPEADLLEAVAASEANGSTGTAKVEEEH